MYFEELNIINIDFVKPHIDNSDTLVNSYCPRDEIAHPLKLQKLCNANNNDSWRLHILDYNQPYFTCKIPWDQKYESYGIVCQASHFRVLCKRPSMFEITKSEITEDSLRAWLAIHHDTIFLISHVVFHGDTVKYISVNEGTVSVDNDIENEMNTILTELAYTIGNGISLILALHRAGLISSNLIINVFSEYFPARSMYYQHIDEDWNKLYYSSKTQLIADFPYIYACFGPNFVHPDVLNLLNTYEMASDTVIMQSYMNDFSIMTRQSAMFPHFNIEHWNKHEEIESWSMTSHTIPQSTVYIINGLGQITTQYQSHTIPDIAGMLSTFTCDDGFVYWNENINRPSFIENIFDIGTLCFKRKRLLCFLKACFHMYTYGTNTPNTVNIATFRSRLQHIWRHVLSNCCTTSDIETSVVTTCILYKTVTNLIEYECIPNEFIDDIFKLCDNNSINLYVERTYTGIVNTHTANLIQLEFPNAIITNTVHTSILVHHKNFSITTKLLSLLKLSNYNKNFITNRLTQKLLCLKHICNSSNSGHIIYDLVCDSIKRQNPNGILI